MTKPLLLRPSVRSETPQGLRFDALLDDFGSLAALPTWPDNVPEGPSAGEQKDEWRRAAAEEILFRQATGRPVPEAWWQAFADVSPFHHPPAPLASLRGIRSACAVFPLNTADADDLNHPGVGHVWILEDRTIRPAINGMDSVPDGFGAAFTATGEWSGRSWQLAAALAHRALQESDPGIREELARQWIVTGRIEGGNRVCPVSLGNKLALTTHRRWLIPLDNYREVPPGFQGELRVAPDVDSAWNHVLGRGFVQGQELPWPDAVDELHILIGGNIKAAAASALFCPPGTRVQLWHSENEKFSRIPAEAVKIVLKRLRPDLEVRRPELLDSRNPVNAERSLRTELARLSDGSAAPSAGRILFNVTSGNRLMSYAVMAVARLYPRILLVYRDIDADPYQFTWLDYSQRPPVSGAFTGTVRAPGKTIANPDFLFNSDRYEGNDAETQADSFLRNLLAPRLHQRPGTDRRRR